MDEILCPNCGYRLALLRKDRQATGQREIVLHWSICVQCKHVALRDWMYIEAPD